MPVYVCPECGKELDLGSGRGDTWPCPGCGATMGRVAFNRGNWVRR